MAVGTFGTDGVDTLSALTWTRQPAVADVAQIAANIKNDQNVAHPIMPGAFSFNGTLHVPNRGVLLLLPGDVVAYDGTGWPILVSAAAIAGGAWTGPT